VYQAVLTRQAAKQLAALDRVAARRIQGVIELLGQNPYPPKALKLAGRGGYRVRIGDYRLLYDVIDDQLIVQVLSLGHR
jgi:mRNA interferase RelE/StbE